jgi:hypothetical protein
LPTSTRNLSEREAPKKTGLVLACYVAATLAGPATAQDATLYLDNRSTAEAVVESFYNAINRGEYARAYSYFEDGEGVEDYDSFVSGYADTEHVELTTGTLASEGAAGSIYYSLPVALDAIDTDNRHTAFAGCYTLRLVNPQLQEPPFRPLHIVKGEIHKIRSGAAVRPPRTCAP